MELEPTRSLPRVDVDLSVVSAVRAARALLAARRDTDVVRRDVLTLDVQRSGHASSARKWATDLASTRDHARERGGRHHRRHANCIIATEANPPMWGRTHANRGHWHQRFSCKTVHTRRSTLAVLKNGGGKDRWMVFTFLGAWRDVWQAGGVQFTRTDLGSLYGEDGLHHDRL